MPKQPEAINEELQSANVDITDIKRASDALTESEERFAAIVNQTTAGIVQTDLTGKIVLVNDRFCDITGYPCEELLKMRLHDITHAEDLPPGAERFQLTATHGEPFTVEMRYVRKDGSPVWVHNTVTAITGADGQPKYILAVTLDITERKQTEEVLRQSQSETERQRRLYDTILSNTPDLAYVFDLNHRFTYANDVLLKMWGRTWDEAIGKNCLELGYEPWHAEMHDREIEQVVATKQPIRGEVPFTGTFGRRIYDYIFVPIIGTDGEVEAIAGTTRDITERKQAEEEIKSLSERNRDILESITDGFFAVDRDWRFTYVNRQAELILDRKPGDLIGKIIWDVYPGLAGSEFEQAYYRTANEGVVSTFTSYYPDHDRWYEVKAYPAPNGVTVYFRNVTERVQSEEALRQSEKQLRLVTDAMPALIAYVDAEQRYRFVNKTYSDWFGHAPEEIIGKHLREVVGEAAYAEVLPAIERVFSGEAFSFELLLPYKDGGSRFVLVNYTPDKDESGKVKGYYALVQDITERKRTEMNLAFLAEISQDLMLLTGVEEIMRTVGAKIGAHLNLSSCTFAEINEAADEAVVNHAWHRADVPGLVGVYRLSDYLTDEFQRASRAGEIFVVRDTQIDSRTDAAAYARLKIGSRLSVPLVHNGEWQFLFAVHHSEPHDWSAEEVELIRELTVRIWTRMERARAEEDLRRRNRQLDLLARTSQQMIVGDKTEAEILQTIFDEVAETLETEFYFNFMVGDEPETLRLLTSGGLSQAQKDFFATIRFGEYLCGTVARRRERLIVERLLECEYAEADALREAGVKSYAGFPLVAHGQLIGTVAFATRNRTHFREGELQLIQTVCDQAAITLERARSEIALRDSEERYRTLFDSIDEGYCILEMMFDAEGKPNDWRFLEVNAAFEKQNGLERATGKTILELAPNIEPKWFEIYGRVAVTGEAIRFVEHSAALHRWFDLYACRFGEPKNRQVAVLFNDITARNRAAEEREQLLAREQAARAEAEAANRLKDEFLAMLSHELRTPLTAILGWTRLMQTNNFDAEQSKRALETVERSARAQNQLIDDLLDVSRIITGNLRLDVSPVELSTVIEAAADAVRPAAEAKDIRLRMLLDPSAGAVSGDANRLQQVIWNLLTNAVKFTPKGGRVEVRLERVNSHVEIVVSDTGQGIAPEFVPHVFDRFRQADQSTTRTHGGLGLGLSIVRQLVEQHGGTVGVESEGVGQGTTFTVKLPRLATVRRRELNKTERVHPTAGGKIPFDCAPSLEGLRVLVVDDESDTRELLRAVLESCDSVVTTAGSAAEALAAFAETKHDVLVCDIGMPEEDGYTLIGKVRALSAEQGGRIPAIALTAYARAEDRVRALMAGFQVHVPKPVEPMELAAVVASLAGRTGQV